MHISGHRRAPWACARAILKKEMMTSRVSSIKPTEYMGWCAFLVTGALSGGAQGDPGTGNDDEQGIVD